LSLQPGHGPAHRGTTRAVMVSQLMLGRETFTRSAAAGQDLTAKLVNDPLVWKRLPCLGHNLILQVGLRPKTAGARAGPQPSLRCAFGRLGRDTGAVGIVL